MQQKDIGNFVVYSDGTVFSKIKNKFIKGTHNSDGYPMVSVDGKQVKTHRLIAECFLPTDPAKPIVNHKNGIKTDNQVENLEWCDHKHNVQHAFKNGLMVRHKGSKNAASKLSEAQVSYIKQGLKDGRTMTSFANEFKVTISAIFHIKRGKNWGHILPII